MDIENSDTVPDYDSDRIDSINNNDDDSNINTITKKRKRVIKQNDLDLIKVQTNDGKWYY
jgi:hypothetical protein